MKYPTMWYIDSIWIIDTLKGLIRHSRDALIEFFCTGDLGPEDSNQKTWLCRIQRLASWDNWCPFCGCGELSKRFWTWARAPGNMLMHLRLHHAVSWNGCRLEYVLETDDDDVWIGSKSIKRMMLDRTGALLGLDTTLRNELSKTETASAEWCWIAQVVSSFRYVHESLACLL